MSSEKPKTYTIYGKQGHLYRTEIKANSDKEAIRLARYNHKDYKWEDTEHLDDWDYEILEVSDE